MEDEKWDDFKKSLERMIEKQRNPVTKIGPVGFAWWILIGLLTNWIGVLVALVLDKRQAGGKTGRTRPALIGFTPWVIAFIITWLGSIAHSLGII